MSQATKKKPIEAFLFPGLVLMNRLSMRFKLGLMGVILFTPLAVLAFMFFSSLVADRTLARNEAAGARVVASAINVVVQTQTHRGQTNLDKAVPLCGWHHRRAHDAQVTTRIHTGPDGRKTVSFTTP